MHTKVRNKCAIALETATQWRADNRMEGEKGYVLVYGKNAFGFEQLLPDIGGRNPICVDEEMDCFFPENSSAWVCVTTPEKMPHMVRKCDHISILAAEQLAYVYPKRAPEISE